jgi:hypothetical protein
MGAPVDIATRGQCLGRGFSTAGRRRALVMPRAPVGLWAAHFFQPAFHQQIGARSLDVRSGLFFLLYTHAATIGPVYSPRPRTLGRAPTLCWHTSVGLSHQSQSAEQVGL